MSKRLLLCAMFLFVLFLSNAYGIPKYTFEAGNTARCTYFLEIASCIMLRGAYWVKPIAMQGGRIDIAG